MVQEGLVCEKERIYALIDTLVRTEELISIRLDDYDDRTGVLRVNHPKGGGSRAVQLSRTTQWLVNRQVDLRRARADQRGYALTEEDPLFTTIHDMPLSYRASRKRCGACRVSPGGPSTSICCATLALYDC